MKREPFRTDCPLTPTLSHKGRGGALFTPSPVVGEGWGEGAP